MCTASGAPAAPARRVRTQPWGLAVGLVPCRLPHSRISPSPHLDPGAGHAHTLFVGANDKPRAGELINVLHEAKQAVPEELLKFGTTVKKKESKVRLGCSQARRQAMGGTRQSSSVQHPLLPLSHVQLYGAHFKDVDHTQKATKMTFDSDDE